MTKTANSLAGYIALLRQLALLCKVGSAIAVAIARFKPEESKAQCIMIPGFPPTILDVIIVDLVTDCIPSRVMN